MFICTTWIVIHESPKRLKKVKLKGNLKLKKGQKKTLILSIETKFKFTVIEHAITLWHRPSVIDTSEKVKPKFQKGAILSLILSLELWNLLYKVT